MKRNILPVLSLAILLGIVLFSCTKKKDDSYRENPSKGYFPLSFGKYVVYDVDSILWDDFQCVKSLHRYQMRHTIVDTFRDDSNRLTYRVDVMIRKQDSLPWENHRVIFVTPTDTRLELVESNLRYIKLVFPISDNVTWQGNSMIPALDQDYRYLQGWTYQYSNYTEPFNDGFTYFENTVTVSHVDEQQNDPETMPNSYAYKTYSQEVYAFNVGMVYREMTHWVYDPSVGTLCRKGYSVVMRAVDHN
jgi:hypothetical protein